MAKQANNFESLTPEEIKERIAAGKSVRIASETLPAFLRDDLPDLPSNFHEDKDIDDEIASK